MEQMLKYYAIRYPKFTFKDKVLTPFFLLFKGGAKNPNIITKTIEEAAKKKGKQSMHELDIPVFIPALDITEKQTVYYTSRKIKDEVCFLDRSIAEAVKSSCSLPFLYLPNTVYINDVLHQFSDGGMTTNTPTTHLNEFVDIVVGIEIKYHKRVEGKKVNLITGIRNTFQAMRRSVVIHQKNASDIWIQVDTKDLDIIGDEQQVETCIKQGYDTVMNMAKEGKLDILLKNTQIPI